MSRSNDNASVNRWFSKTDATFPNWDILRRKETLRLNRIQCVRRAAFYVFDKWLKLFQVVIPNTNNFKTERTFTKGVGTASPAKKNCNHPNQLSLAIETIAPSNAYCDNKLPQYSHILAPQDLRHAEEVKQIGPPHIPALVQCCSNKLFVVWYNIPNFQN